VQAGAQGWSCAAAAAACGDRRRDQDVEGAKLDLIVMLAGVQRVEVRDAIDAEDHGFAVEHEQPLPDLARVADQHSGESICRSIIEGHGGQIWATSNGQQGAAFNFTLPTVPREIASQSTPRMPRRACNSGISSIRRILR
jgi:hypothetical protein